MKAPRKNMERMEEYVKECDYESTQHFISESPWNHRDFIAHVARDVNAVIGGPDSVLAIDESAFTKKGNKSAGVSRQYNGRLGKIDNCQVGVFGALSDGERVSLVDVRLYLPQEWVDSPHRCELAGIPEEERVFRSKPELGLQIIEEARKNGLRFGWVCFDGFYGNVPEFTRKLDEDNQQFVGAIHKDQIVYLEPPSPYLPRRTGNKGRKYSRYRTKEVGIRVDALNEQNASRWHLITIREGTKGYVGYLARRMRVWLWENDTDKVKEVWFLTLKDPFSNEMGVAILYERDST
jgi:SRSO17 transposase